MPTYFFQPAAIQDGIPFEPKVQNTENHKIGR